MCSYIISVVYICRVIPCFKEFTLFDVAGNLLKIKELKNTKREHVQLFWKINQNVAFQELKKTLKKTYIWLRILEIMIVNLLYYCGRCAKAYETWAHFRVSWKKNRISRILYRFVHVKLLFILKCNKDLFRIFRGITNHLPRSLSWTYYDVVQCWCKNTKIGQRHFDFKCMAPHGSGVPFYGGITLYPRSLATCHSCIIIGLSL